MEQVVKGREWIIQGSKIISDNALIANSIIKKGLKICPTEGVGWFNLGLALHQNKKIAEAIRSYRKGLIYANKVERSIIINNLAQDLLLHGEYLEGWELYENRFKQMEKTFSTYETLFGPAWQGLDDIRECKELVIIAEQGYGDTIQFCRLVLILQEYGIKISLFCQEALAPLLRNATNINEITIGLVGSNTSNQFWCPLMSLPKHLAINNNNIPFKSGYINPEPKDVEGWRKKLKRKAGKKLIALHWQGNPEFEKKLYSRGRSIGASYFKIFKNIQDLEFISIQKGKSMTDQSVLQELEFVEGQKEFDQSMNFVDTAAVLQNCDLLISSDSSVVHLAGAMNIPTWIALSWVPEWRWGLDGSESIWYDSIRVYRQKRMGDWENVVKEMAMDLRVLSKNKTNYN